jgi:hypothetical protein
MMLWTDKREVKTLVRYTMSLMNHTRLEIQRLEKSQGGNSSGTTAKT